jgi:hypothetical protein
MKFETSAGKQRSRRSKGILLAPAVVETLEIRSLLTQVSLTGPVSGTPPVINDATPTMTWDTDSAATSYDLWITDAEQRTVELIERGITQNSFTPTDDLNLGLTRVWVRSNYSDGSSSPWSPPTLFVVKVTPSVTGPVNALWSTAPHKLEETKPTITWTSPPGALRFEINFSDRTMNTSKTVTLQNLTPVLDEDGVPMVDASGEIVRQEVRSWEVPEELLMGSYSVTVRSFDDAGRPSAVSAAYNFEVAPTVKVTRPTGITFQNPPLLEWQAVPGATDYDVWVSKTSAPNAPLYNLRFHTGTSYQIPGLLANGDYVFWIRAHRRVSGVPDTIGSWSRPANFSTLRNPVITGPVGIQLDSPSRRIVTDARPTVTWTAIDKAGRYEIWVDVSHGRTPYLITRSSTNSYRFEQDIKPGKYEVWVRAASTTGVLTGWSKAYAFEATGGAPVITSPVANTSVLPIPDITWTAVPDANSYEIWFAWVGEDYDYIVADGIASTNYSPTGPLPTGTYRVWVRAIKSDGSALPWSTPVTFSVAANEVEKMEVEVPELLVALLPATGNSRANAVAETMAGDPIEPEARNEVNSGVRLPSESVATLPTSAVVAMSAETEGFIQQLAQQCATEEWWMPQSSGT